MVKQRFSMRVGARTCALVCASVACAAGIASAEPPATKPNEAQYYPIREVAIPKDAVLEVSALEWLPEGRLAVASRRGEIWIVTDPAGEKPQWKRFAHGLHEVLGLAWKDGWLYVTQRPEVSRLRDTDGDGEADEFETVADGWGMTGDYHEYAFGSKFDRDGNIWVALCLTGSFDSNAPFRGWAMRVTPDGRLLASTSGVRSPGGIGFDCQGNVLYTDNQGPWNGACSLKRLVPGKFVGHPGGLRWYDLAPEMGKKPQEPKSGSRWADEVKKIPELIPPVVVFPYNTMGQSAAGVVCDSTAGKFGPFAEQVFVTDQSHSTVMRCCLEEIDGVLQGACFKFREGFRSGSLALQFSPDGSLFVGGTNRGWGSRGAGDFALERVSWTGETPFEIRWMRALPDGFELEFTLPVDPATAGHVASYAAKGFAYIFQASYGSPVVDEAPCPVERAEVSANGRRVRLTMKNLRECVIHEVKAAGVRSAEGLPLMHDTGWYTLNRLPVPPRIARAEGLDDLRVGPVPESERARLALDARYTQYVRAAEGIPVIASANVQPQALAEAAWLIGRMLHRRPDVARAIARSPVRFVVMAYDEFTTDVPEHADLTPHAYWDKRARGLGATLERPATSCGEENLLCFPGDPYATENILIHEFAHTIHEIGLRDADPTFEPRLAAAFESAGKNGRWKGTYARTNVSEYWAEGVQSWFACNRTHDDEHGNVNSPEAVREHDPALAALLVEVFGDEPWCYVRPHERDDCDTSHLDGFDREQAPAFDWKRLKDRTSD